MGFGDPYHKHALALQTSPEEGTNCVRCEQSISGESFGCERCNYFIHKCCCELLDTMWHPLHEEHPLTLLAPSVSYSLSNNANTTTNMCNKCHTPCLGFTYHCSTCQFFLHLKCFLTLEHKKHEHPLSFIERTLQNGYDDVDYNCSICGNPAIGLSFACASCNFYIHPECIFVPPKVKHHHVHELTFNYNFPEECDQVYCDLCEDRDGELDPSSSYYYCNSCDYIAHVLCVIQPKEVTIRFKHIHPLRYSRIRKRLFSRCSSCGAPAGDSYYFCNQCNYMIHKSCALFPTSLKHPFHQEHILALEDNGEENSMSLLQCSDCDFSLELGSALIFRHPCHNHELWFSCSDSKFRCDACGELGEGFKMQCVWKADCNFDIHLECFALPGEIHSETHQQHPLFLLSSPTHVPSYELTSQCSVCSKEMDPELWIYCCQECNYFAHLNCVSSDLLSTLRSSIKNELKFCAIVQPDEKLFTKSISDPEEDICMSISLGNAMPLSLDFPLWFIPDRNKQFEPSEDGDDQETDDSVTAPTLENAATLLDDVLLCPKCNLSVPTGAYSCIKDWEFKHGISHEENIITTTNDPASTHSDHFTLIDEKIVDELYCPICSFLIFFPTYSCPSCNIFFHKSCAELPRKYTSERGHIFSLESPPFLNNLSNCSHCNYPIIGYAYICSTCEVILDVQCALGAPLIKLMNHEHRLCGWRCMSEELMCKACCNLIEIGAIYFDCYVMLCEFQLHVECALLPPIIKHRIHQHPLELAPDLAEFGEEYICDACEKDLNPNLWAYKCLDSCGLYATSHVTCVINTKKKRHFIYEEECQGMGIGC